MDKNNEVSSTERGQLIEKLDRFIAKASRICGKIVSGGSLFVIHYMILVQIAKKLEFDILSYPDTMEYRLIIGYLLVTQLAFLDWLWPKFSRLIDFLAKPIAVVGNVLEVKLEKYFQKKEIESKEGED